MLHSDGELFVDETERSILVTKANSLPHLEISEMDLQWVQVLAEGWAAPLKGFMREKEYLQVLFFGGLVRCMSLQNIVHSNAL